MNKSKRGSSFGGIALGVYPGLGAPSTKLTEDPVGAVMNCSKWRWGLRSGDADADAVGVGVRMEDGRPYSLRRSLAALVAFSWMVWD